MKKQLNIVRWAAWSGVVLFLLAAAVLIPFSKIKKNPTSIATIWADEQTPEEPISEISEVRVIHPKRGVVAKLSTQPGTVQAFESVHLYAKVPGFLKQQKVDIGDRVKRGQVLAVVDVPELQAQWHRSSAAIDQANAKVKQMKARVECAVADLKAARAAVTQSEAKAKSCAAMVRFRDKELKRIELLWKNNSIEFALVDEKKEQSEAAIEAELAAKAAIITNNALVDSGIAKIDQTQADVEAAKSEVKVAEAELERAKAQVDFSTITAPFDGVVTQRGYFEGDYIRSANDGGVNAPLLTIHRTDMMRVVVMVPDRDVPFTDPGDSAELEIDSLPGKRLTAKVSRIAKTLDPQTRLMRVELDLPNPTGQICHGMYGQVTIVLDKQKDLLSIPAACLVGKSEDDYANVYVISDGHAHQSAIHVGASNGLRVLVLDGLTTKDEIIYQPGAALSDGAEVHPVVWDESSAKLGSKSKITNH